MPPFLQDPPPSAGCPAPTPNFVTLPVTETLGSEQTGSTWVLSQRPCP